MSQGLGGKKLRVAWLALAVAAVVVVGFVALRRHGPRSVKRMLKSPEQSEEAAPSSEFFTEGERAASGATGDVNLFHAVAWFRLGHFVGCDECTARLVEYCLSGLVIGEPSEQWAKTARRLSRKSSLGAALGGAAWLRTGMYGPTEEERAAVEKNLIVQADAGEVRAQFVLSEMKGDSAFKYLQKAAAAGFLPAVVQLPRATEMAAAADQSLSEGQRDSLRKSVPTLKKRAMAALKRQVAAGDLNAKFLLARILVDEGEFEKARPYLEAAAEHGHVEASRFLWKDDGHLGLSPKDVQRLKSDALRRGDLESAREEWLENRDESRRGDALVEATNKAFYAAKDQEKFKVAEGYVDAYKLGGLNAAVTLSNFYNAYGSGGSEVSFESFPKKLRDPKVVRSSQLKASDLPALAAPDTIPYRRFSPGDREKFLDAMEASGLVTKLVSGPKPYDEAVAACGAKWHLPSREEAAIAAAAYDDKVAKFWLALPPKQFASETFPAAHYYDYTYDTSFIAFVDEPLPVVCVESRGK